MKENVVLLGIIVLLASVSAQEFPVTETVSIIERGDHYAHDFTLPVYVRRGVTYEMEERMITVTIEPQVWSWEYNGILWQYDFSKVHVFIAIMDSRGRITSDFESYLNCSLKDCDHTIPQTFLFWDHAGEERADKAGEIFEGDTPVVVKDEYCEVTVTLVGFLESFWPCDPVVKDCESDSECITFLRALTVEVVVDYSTTYRAFAELLERATDHVERGDASLEAKDYDEARSEYEKAKTIYDNMGDTLRSGMVYEKVVEVDLLIASAYMALGEEFFEAGEYDKALQEYEKAKEIYSAVNDMELLGAVEEMIKTCESYRAATENLEKGKEVFGEAKHTRDKEEAIKKYEEAKLYFETARAKFSELGDVEKSDECTTWIYQCDTELDMFSGTERAMEPEEPVSSYNIVWIAGIIGVAVVLGLLYKFVRASKVPVTPKRKESEELKTLKYRLATGEITIEEYEKIKSALENE